MPLQNRVQPSGEIIAHPAYGLFMGNRGILHDENQRLGPALWRHRSWVCCALEFKGRKRKLMQPGCYTELFFLDEAVALAAGHRPCAECRRADFDRWRDAWERATGNRPMAAEMDKALHAARARWGGRAMRHWHAPAGDLPPGTFVKDGEDVLLLLAAQALPYAPDGYGPARARPGGEVTVLTPEPSVAALREGYAPLLHLSAKNPRFP